MINWTKTQQVWNVNRAVVSTQLSLIQEGMAAVAAIEGGVMKVQPSGGATSGIGSKLQGIFMSPRRTFATNLTSVTVTIPSGGGTVLLPNTTTNLTDIGVFNAAGGAQLTVTASAASSSNVQAAYDSVTGFTSLTFDSTGYGLGGGTILNVFYTYAMSPAVETGLFGNSSPGFYNTDLLGKVGLFKIGNVATNCYDPQANWYSGTNDPGVKVIAGGLFTDTGSSSAGFIPTNVDVVSLPTVGSPWLELEIH